MAKYEGQHLWYTTPSGKRATDFVFKWIMIVCALGIFEAVGQWLFS